jgi:hypothetical protein
MTIRALIPLSAFLSLALGCDAQQPHAHQHQDQQDNAVAQADGVAAQEAHESDCAKEAQTTELTDDHPIDRKDAQGRSVVHLGAELSRSEALPVAQLLTRGAEFDGQTVVLEGDVSAMCGHRRAWFAVNAGDQSGKNLRVITAPAFLVPPDSVGKSALVEGIVELLEVKASHAEHISEEHKLGESGEVGDGTVTQVVLRAKGADFF